MHVPINNVSGNHTQRTTELQRLNDPDQAVDMVHSIYCS